MENNIEKRKDEKKYPVFILMDKEDYDMLITFAKIERRAKSNAALMLIRNSLQALFANNNNKTI